MSTNLVLSFSAGQFLVDGSSNIMNLTENTLYTIAGVSPSERVRVTGAASIVPLAGTESNVVNGNTFFSNTFTLQTAAVTADSAVTLIGQGGSSRQAFNVQADSISIFIGMQDFQAANITENGGQPLTGQPEFMDIEYTVSCNLPGSDLVDMLANVGIAVSLENFDDFVDAGEARIDDVRTYQLNAGYSLDLAGAATDFGALDATLTGNFDSSAGSDAVQVDGVNYAIDMANQMKVAAALPKALGSQMPLTNGKDDVFRVMINEADFKGLLKFGLKGYGATDINGVTGVTLQSLIRSAHSNVADTITYADITDSSTTPCSQRKLGHEILSSLFRANPCTPSNTNLASGTTWKHEADDYLSLQKLEQNVNLQFVLKTELNLVDGDGSTILSSNPSPSLAAGQTAFDATAPTGTTKRVLILYNFVFTA